MQSSFTWKNDYETHFLNLFLPSATVAKSYFSLQVIAYLRVRSKTRPVIFIFSMAKSSLFKSNIKSLCISRCHDWLPGAYLVTGDVKSHFYD